MTPLNQRIFNKFLEDIEDGNIDLSRELLTAMGKDPKDVEERAKKLYKRQMSELQAFQNKRSTEQLKEENIVRVIFRVVQNKIEKRITRFRMKPGKGRIVHQDQNLEKLNLEEPKIMIKVMKSPDLVEQLERMDESV